MLFRSFDEAGLKGPSSTWTYLINDNPFPNFSLALIASSNIGIGAFAGMLMGVFAPFIGIASLVGIIKKRLGKKG